MIKNICISLILLLGIGSGELISQNQYIINNGANSFRLTESTDEYLEVELSFNNLESFEVNAEGEEYLELISEGLGHTQGIGAPKLPAVHKLIEIPYGSSVDVEIIASSFKTYTMDDFASSYIFPLQAPVPKCSTDPPEFIMEKDIYNEDSFFPGMGGQCEDLGFLRATNLARISIFPVQYNPVRGELRIYDKLILRYSFRGGDHNATLSGKQRYHSPYFNALSQQVLNYKKVLPSRDSICKYPLKYVIVSESMFQAVLQPFVQWKTEKGFTVIQAYTDNPQVGNTTSSIKAYLQDLYESGTLTDPAPSFVLFVGDVDQVPAFSGSGHVTDLYYCEYTGDYLPEVYYGRFSATTIEQLLPQINKTLEYEKYEMSDPSFLNEVVMAAGMDSGHGSSWGNGQINYGTSYYFNESHGLTSHTYLYPESGSHSQDIIQHVSDGVAYANYTAHGNWDGWSDPSFKNSDIPGLQNQGKYPLMVGNCCLTNKFEVDECFGEALLRAENKGALGYIGGSNSTYWDEDYYWGVGVGNIVPNPTYAATGLGAYDRTFHDNGEAWEEWYITMDQMIFAGNLAVTEGSSSYDYYWEIYHLMGDPSLMVYFSAPFPVTANYEELVPVNTQNIEINTDPYAYAAISSEGVLLGAAQANMTGTAMVAIDPVPNPDTLKLVITHQNKEPHFGSIYIVGEPSQASNPYPANNAATVHPFTSFNWDKGNGGTPDTYTFYLGTDNPPTNLINGQVLYESFFNPDFFLDFDTQYFWKVDSENEYGAVSGEVWAFHTIEAPDEDFESGDFSSNMWEFAGEQPWQTDTQQSFFGTYAARSGIIGDKQSSSLIIKLGIENFFNASISFYKKVSSDNGDKLQFLIDGVVIDEWSGFSIYSQEVYPVTQGEHTFEWRYIKDESNTAGDDGAWIDYIYFPPLLPSSAYAGNDTTICEEESFIPQPDICNICSINWSTSGSGSFDDPKLIHPVYSPSQEDIENGAVIISLLAETYTEPITDQLNLNFDLLPGATGIPEGPDYVDVYFNETTDYYCEALPNADSIVWTLLPENAGVWSYIDNYCSINWNTEFLGDAELRAQGYNHCGQGPLSDPLEIEVINTVTINDINQDIRIQIIPNPCINETQLLSNKKIPLSAIKLLNVFGKEQNASFKTSDNKRITLSGRELSSGIYFINIKTDDMNISKKLIVQ